MSGVSPVFGDVTMPLASPHVFLHPKRELTRAKRSCFSRNCDNSARRRKRIIWCRPDYRRASPSAL